MIKTICRAFICILFAGVWITFFKAIGYFYVQFDETDTRGVIIGIILLFLLGGMLIMGTIGLINDILGKNNAQNDSTNTQKKEQEIPPKEHTQECHQAEQRHIRKKEGNRIVIIILGGYSAFTLWAVYSTVSGWYEGMNNALLVPFTALTLLSCFFNVRMLYGLSKILSEKKQETPTEEFTIEGHQEEQKRKNEEESRRIATENFKTAMSNFSMEDLRKASAILETTSDLFFSREQNEQALQKFLTHEKKLLNIVTWGKQAAIDTSQFETLLSAVQIGCIHFKFELERPDEQRKFIYTLSKKGIEEAVREKMNTSASYAQANVEIEK